MKNYLTAVISASAVRHNLKVLRGLIAPGVKLCPVVKDDCYGHGMDVLYPVLADMVDGFMVAAPTEALELRTRGFKGFLLCFLSAYFDDLAVQEELIEQEVTQTVMSKSALQAISAAAVRCGKSAAVHLKIDSGMGRLGVPAHQAKRLISLIADEPLVELTGVYTHFATAGEADRAFMLEQLARFRAALPNGEAGLVRHAANSAALISAPDTHLDMVRPGLAVYGCHQAGHLRADIDLRPCMAVEAKLIAIKKMPSGSHSGYGRTHRYTRESRVAIVPIGYGDGYFRCLSSRSAVRMHGLEAPVCGRVSMDQITVDVTDIPAVEVGDTVEIIAADAAAPNSVENLARLAGTIPYEITCQMGRKIKRRLVD